MRSPQMRNAVRNLMDCSNQIIAIADELEEKYPDVAKQLEERANALDDVRAQLEKELRG